MKCSGSMGCSTEPTVTVTWAPSDLDHGDVLLHRGVGGAGDQLGHLLAAAAHHRDAAGFDKRDDVAAVLTRHKTASSSPLLNRFEWEQDALLLPSLYQGGDEKSTANRRDGGEIQGPSTILTRIQPPSRSTSATNSSTAGIRDLPGAALTT